MLGDTISVLDGNTFVVSDRGGDIDASPDRPHGLFHEDMRYVSRFRLLVDGTTPTVLSTDDVAHHSAQFFLVVTSGSMVEDAPISIIRSRTINRGFTDDITILNHAAEPAKLSIRFDCDADFADLFEVKERLSKTGDCYRQATEDELVLGYRRQSYVRETRVTTDRPDGQFSSDGLSFEAEINARGEWRAQIIFEITADIQTTLTNKRSVIGPPGNVSTKRRNDVADWLKRAPTVRTDWNVLEDTYRQSLIDLAALRLPAFAPSGAVVPAAGLPWFMCLFGRDSLITSYQALPFVPEFARSTLQLLALLQAQTSDDFRDAEPGKILHELRSGELTTFEERPHSPYYGTSDATPLFLILLDEYERWTGDEALVHKLEPNARAALRWIDEHGDRDGDGYVEYQRRNTETGLENQCWKDSATSIVFADGTVAPGPRATCEIQGYVYDAKRRTARLARSFWGDNELGDRLEQQAVDLKKRFNHDFWIPGRDCFALALDGKKRKVDALTSNIGHLLWSGIADDDKAEACARHLVTPPLFSGWGVRTMASSEAGYNPVGYHTGTVWPHDNALIAHGLARYGHRDEAALIALAILEAGSFFQHRLPEAFAGYSRDRTRFPVEFPTACSPQAWAAGSTLLFLRTLLGLEPQGFRLSIDPALPTEIDYIDLTGIPGRWGRTNARSRDAKITPETTSGPDSIEHVLRALPEHVRPSDLASVKGTIQFDIVDGDTWHLTSDDTGLVVKPGPAREPDCTIRATASDLLDIYRGVKTPNLAAMQGTVQLDGDIAVALAYGTLFAAAGERARTPRPLTEA